MHFVWNYSSFCGLETESFVAQTQKVAQLPPLPPLARNLRSVVCHVRWGQKYRKWFSSRIAAVGEPLLDGSGLRGRLIRWMMMVLLDLPGMLRGLSVRLGWGDGVEGRT